MAADEMSLRPDTGAEPETLLKQATRLHQAGDLRAAEAGYRAVLDAEPDNAAAIHFLGMLAHAAGRRDEAIEMVRRSVTLAPKKAGFRANLAVVYGQMGRTAEALHCLRDAARLDASSCEIQKNLGLMLEAAEEFDEAVAAYDRALRLSNVPELQAHRLRALAKAGRAPAGRDLPAAKHADEAWSHALAALEYVYESGGRLSDAIAAQRRLIALQPTSAAAHSVLLFLLRSFRHHSGYRSNPPQWK